MGSEYDFIITLQDYSFEKGIYFTYEMTAPADKKGQVYISAAAKEKARKYVNYLHRWRHETNRCYYCLVKL
jgi:hypothetical protein